MASRIEDYALIADCKSAALVGRDGSIDWLCWPRFDSAACFAALLGTPENGRWLMAPKEVPRAVRRRYRPGTLVLETEFETATGRAVVIDFMSPEACGNLVRIVRGRTGRVEFRTEFVVRFNYGATVPWMSRRDDGALDAIAGPERVVLRTPAMLYGVELKTIGEFTVEADESMPFVLSCGPSYQSLPPAIDPFAALERAEDFWRKWSDRCPDVGCWTPAVKRSLITLKALTYAPTGGMVAAATTSLPERLGGVRNWDYRYCWLRDATFTLLAFMQLGYQEEARAWRDWLLRAVAGSPNQIQIMYGVGGERWLPELIVDWLPGYERSAPVRIGNAAYQQLQLDIIGEMADAMFQAFKGGMQPSARARELRPVVLEYLEKAWREPDKGIWEVRGGRRHFVHSKVMAWVAFDRAANAAYSPGEPTSRWRKIADEIHAEVCERGFDRELGSFVQAYGSKQLDASLLLIPIVGFLPAHDPRVRGTLRAIEERLLIGGEFVLRYESDEADDGLPPGEGAFLACSFWLVDNYILQGRHAEARKLFDRLIARCNDVGLLAEEIDPLTGRMLGNFPQAYSHVGLINAALSLTRETGPAEERAEPVAAAPA
ncbi:MAG: glycoside hydrolase family 15 protein [Hyphomicrobiales bacterium]|nr:glycoside hydrolase family 15 protein [Hyphomicrobiales bacterium]MBV8824751.1 glycoside hydrolase family 15 protein [Hyphomicrobiales bacterium]MBV9427041.1 glycoside hydrolase family 15 protein [Bradyrhizobiaceae bacterium]